MWYVVDVKPGASLYSGFSRRITPEEYVRRVADNTITDVLQRYEVKAGDVFFLPAGRIHAIGKGCLIAEIQQTSDITYRIYDYDRRDANGNGRVLHTELAKDAIDYTVYPDYRTHYTCEINSATELVKCKYFTTSLINSKQTITRHLNADSFVIYTCLAGEAEITDGYRHGMRIRAGEVVLIPAETPTAMIKADKYSVKLLETCVI
jgi:mannose-6-phosphate isomerase